MKYGQILLNVYISMPENSHKQALPSMQEPVQKTEYLSEEIKP